MNQIETEESNLDNYNCELTPNLQLFFCKNNLQPDKLRRYTLICQYYQVTIQIIFVNYYLYELDYKLYA